MIAMTSVLVYRSHSVWNSKHVPCSRTLTIKCEINRTSLRAIFVQFRNWSIRPSCIYQYMAAFFHFEYYTYNSLIPNKTRAIFLTVLKNTIITLHIYITFRFYWNQTHDIVFLWMLHCWFCFQLNAVWKHRRIIGLRRGSGF